MRAAVVLLAVIVTAIPASSAVLPDGVEGDGQTSIEYDANTGAIAVDAPQQTSLTTIQIDSADCILTGDPAMNLGGSFDTDTDCRIFKLGIGGFFSLSFGDVAEPGLSEAFVLDDLTVTGALLPSGGVGDVDLIYLPEPAGGAAALIALISLALFASRTTIEAIAPSVGEHASGRRPLSR